MAYKRTRQQKKNVLAQKLPTVLGEILSSLRETYANEDPLTRALSKFRFGGMMTPIEVALRESLVLLELKTAVLKAELEEIEKEEAEIRAKIDALRANRKK
eukprot:gene8302-1574_t